MYTIVACVFKRKSSEARFALNVTAETQASSAKVLSIQWRIQRVFLVARKPPPHRPWFFFIICDPSDGQLNNQVAAAAADGEAWQNLPPQLCLPTSPSLTLSHATSLYTQTSDRPLLLTAHCRSRVVRVRDHLSLSSESKHDWDPRAVMTVWHTWR